MCMNSSKCFSEKKLNNLLYSVYCDTLQSARSGNDKIRAATITNLCLITDNKGILYSLEEINATSPGKY